MAHRLAWSVALLVSLQLQDGGAWVVSNTANVCGASGRHWRRPATRMQGDAGVSTEEMIKVFGRLAEKRLFLDSSAGACCHSGCDGCPYRYDFDIMRAIRPKWVPTYAERIFDSDSHRAKWRSLFDVPESQASAMSDEDMFNEVSTQASALTYETFAERLRSLEYMPPLGVPVEVSEGELSPAITQLIWDKVTGGAPQLSADLMQKRLAEWANGGDSLMWGDFQTALSS